MRTEESFSHHTPILVDEILEFARHPLSVLEKQPLCVDGTLGDGGHTISLMHAYPHARFIGSDRDPRMIHRASERIEALGMKEKARILRTRFSELPEHLEDQSASFMLLDLGISMYHFVEKDLGFSYTSETLDMRLEPDARTSALDIVNRLTEKELADIIYKYGEETKSRKLARFIVEKRPIKSAKQLAEIAIKALGGGRIHPATRLFQALRIAVNQELQEIEMAMVHLPKLLKVDGVLAVISFHSLEDRLVKHGMKAQPKEHYSILTKKPILPSEAEIKANPASRSAKLRCLQRIV